MGNWVIVAVLVSILATVWLAGLLWRINKPAESRNRSGAGDGPTVLAADRGRDIEDGGSGDGGGDGGGD